MRLTSIYIVFLYIFIGSCSKDKHDLGGDTCNIKRIDTANAKATYNSISKCDQAIVDSTYSGLFDYFISENKYDLIAQHLQQYKSLGRNDREATALIAKTEGYYYNYRAQYDSAYLFFEQAIQLSGKARKQNLLADAYAGMAMNYTYKGDYLNASKYHYQSLAIYERLKDSNNIFRISSEMAVDFYYQKDFDKAIALANANKDYYERKQGLEMIAYNESILATIYYNLKKYDSSISFSLSSLKIRKQLGSPHDIGESLNNLSLGYMATEKWKEAADVLTESIALMKSSNDNRQLPIIRQNLAYCIWRLGETGKAVGMLHDVIAEARQIDQKDAIANAYKKLYEVYRESKQFDSALRYFQRYRAMRDTLYNIEKENAINELNIKYETEKKEQQIRQLHAEKKISSIKQLIYLLIILFIIIVTTLLVLYLTSRNRKNKLLIEKVQLELETNQKDLDQFTANIISKNKLIDDLEGKLQVLSQRPAQQDDNDALSALYQFKILTEDDWRHFKIHFDKVYPGYINNLRNQFPDLSPAEERQLLLIKLNIDTKECADMLGISVQSVKKNRYRLKKKFNLSENDSLDEFVRTLAF